MDKESTLRYLEDGLISVRRAYEASQHLENIPDVEEIRNNLIDAINDLERASNEVQYG